MSQFEDDVETHLRKEKFLEDLVVEVWVREVVHGTETTVFMPSPSTMGAQLAKKLIGDDLSLEDLRDQSWAHDGVWLYAKVGGKAVRASTHGGTWCFPVEVIVVAATLGVGSDDVAVAAAKVIAAGFVTREWL